MIDDIKLYGIFFRCPKDMTPNGNRYIIKFDQCDQIKLLNDKLKYHCKSFLKDNNPKIEVIKNETTNEIFDDDNEYIVINIKSINGNNYPKIHILPWMN